MTRRALVIGAQTGELKGVHNDVATMTALLREREFAVDSRHGADATQQGIRDGYDKLIEDAKKDDAVVVYYSGHGARAEVNTPNGNPLPPLQCIVPTDYHESRPGDFRGITAQELSVRLARLTEKTRNVTVILDCCHAGHMSRDHKYQPKGHPYPTYLDIAEHLGIERQLGLRLDLPHVESNPHAVRLLACAPWESAFEQISHGQPAGLLTDAFRHGLAVAGDARVPWNLLIQRIRSRVGVLQFGQRPDVAGPSRRWLFETDEPRGGTAFAVRQHRSGAPAVHGKLTLPGAGLLAVAPGDTFGLTAADTPATEETIVATATVTGTDGVTVHATYDLRAGRTALPLDLEAHPLTVSAPRNPVIVRGDDATAAEMRAAVDATPGLRAVTGTDGLGVDPPIADLTIEDRIYLWDGGSDPLTSAPVTEAGIEWIAGNLRRLARTAGLRRLEPGPGSALTDPFTVEWGRVVGGHEEPIPPVDARLHVDDPVFIRLRNDSERILYFHVFDLGVAGAVTLISANDPGGLRLLQNAEYIIGERDRGGLEGSPLTWPADVATTCPRRESLLVIVTTDWQDLSVLGHGGIGAPLGGSRKVTGLAQALADAVGPATTRDWKAPTPSTAKFDVRRLDFTLDPAARTPVTSLR